MSESSPMPHPSDLPSRALAALADIDGLWTWNVTTGDCWWSDRLQQLLGYEPGEWAPHISAWRDRLHPEDAETLEATLDLGAVEDLSTMELRLRAKDGRWVWMLDRSLITERDANGAATRMAGSHVDIDARKRAEMELAQTTRQYAQKQAHLKAAQRLARIGSWAWDARTQCVTASAEMRRLFGFDDGAKTGTVAEFFALAHPEDRGTQKQDWDVLVRTIRETPALVPRTGGRFERHTRRHDDSFIWTRSHWIPEFDEQDQIVGLLGVVQDITEEREAALARADADARAAALIDNAMDAIVSTDGTGRITGFNAAAEVLFRCPAAEALGTQVHRFLPAERAQAHAGHVDAFAQHGSVSRRMGGSPAPLMAHRADGTPFWMEVTISRLALRGEIVLTAICRDVSERVRVELERQRTTEQLQQAQRLEAIGRLAGGVAHDFNNLLTIIIGNASIISGHANLPADLHDIVRDVERTSQRAAGVARQLLAFSRPRPVALRVFDLNESIRAVTRILSRLLGEDVELHVASAPGSLLVRGDVGLLDQVILNLAVNARDAMPTGGQLTVRTAVRYESRTGHPMPPRGWATIEVRDSGTGIAIESLGRIFEPFFSTKAPGAGTGLGLTMVQSIITQHAGMVTVDSTPGAGSTFTLWIPVSDAALPDEVTEPTEGQTRGGSECLLVVEDEPALRRLSCKVLRDAGYRVIEAGNMPEALARYAESGSDIELLFTDLIMPGGTGMDLAARIRALAPAMRVLVTTGHDSRADTTPITDPILEKPYRPARLLAAVRSALDDRVV